MVNLDYLYNPEAAKPYFNKDYFLDKKLGFQVIEKGIILPQKDNIIDGRWTHGKGGIVDSKGEYFAESFAIPGLSRGIYTPPPESIQHSSETVIYFDMLYPTWGHLITDNLKRVWFFRSEYFKQFKDCPIVCTIFGHNDRERQPGFIERRPDFKRLLEILEFDVSKLREIMQPTQFERIILPDISFFSPHYKIKVFTNEYRETISRVRDFALKNRTPISSKKFYFFHGKRNQIGEERLAQYLESKGYEIINPEKQKLTFDEELNILINCESYISSNGSVEENTMFSRDNVEKTIIIRSPWNFHYYPEVCLQVHPLNLTYIDSSLSLFSGFVSSSFPLYIISEQLKRFFGDKWNGYEEEDFKSFLQLIKTCTSRGLTAAPGATAYYASIFTDFMAQLKRRKDLIAAYNMPPDWDTFLSTLTYQTHVHMKGWRDGYKSENQCSNPIDQELEILAIQINYTAHKVYCSVYYNDKEGWSEEVLAPEMVGTVGVRKPIYGMRVRLDEAGSKEFDILYRMHKFDGEWTKWAKNGEALYSHGVKVNAIQIKLEPVNIQPAQEIPKQSVELQTFSMKNGEAVHWQRQDLNQMYKGM